MPFRKRTKSKKAYNKKSSSNTKNNEQKQILLKNSSSDENDIGVVLCKLNDILPMNPADFYIGFVFIPIELGLYTKRRK